MDKTEIIVGLDIGTTKIATIVGKKNEHGKIEILGYGKSESFGVARGKVINIGNTVQAIEQSINEATKKSNVIIKAVHVGIAGQHIRSLQHRGQKTLTSIEHEISQSDIDSLGQDMMKLAMQPGEQIISVIPQEYFVDNEMGVKDPIGMCGVRLEANCHIIVGQFADVKNIYKCVERAGLEVEGLFLEPLASSESVLTEEEKEAGVVLVDIGGGTTDVAIFQDGIIRHTAVIPFGGNVITEDIRLGCSLIRKQAEILKIKYGSAFAAENNDNEIVAIPGLKGREPKEISVKNLAQIIQARMQEIIEIVNDEIRSSGYAGRLSAGIVATGGGSQLRHIRQLFEYITGMDVRIGYPNEHLAKSTDELKSPMFATGVGLVMKGFEETEKNRRIANPVNNDDRKKTFEEKGATVKQPVKSKSFFQVFVDWLMKEEEDQHLD